MEDPDLALRFAVAVHRRADPRKQDLAVGIGIAGCGKQFRYVDRHRGIFVSHGADVSGYRGIVPAGARR